MAPDTADEIAAYTTAGWWGTETLTDLLAGRLRARPGEVALVDAPDRGSWCPGEQQRLTWAELAGLVNGTAQQLRAAGVDAGDRVGVQLPNVTELVVTLLAVLRIGAVAVPFPVQHRRHELQSGWDTAQLHAFVTAPRADRPDQVEAIVNVASPSEATVLVFGAEATSADITALDLEPLPWPDAPDDNEPGDANGIATICWTSGTTGTPKGVPRSHNCWVAAGRFNVSGVGLSADDRVLCPFPLVNMAGIGGMLVPWLLTGYRLVLHQPFDLPTFLSQISQEQITYTVAPPALLNMLLRSDELLAQADLSSVRTIGSGAAPLDPAMVAGWQHDHDIEVVNIFGSNEGAAMLATAALVPDPALRARMFPAIGRTDANWDTPVASINRTRLVDLDTDEDIDEPGRVGELRFHGPTVFGGYLDSDGTEFDHRGYYRTGDLFELHADHEGRRYYRFVDRAKDIIIRGGMNISATEVETLLAAHDGVREVAVVAAPGGDLGEVVAAVVVADRGEPPGLDHLVDHLRDMGVASYKLPERLAVVDALPRNALGKVVKSDLEALFS